MLPLGLRNCLSGIANETIFTIKASAVASIITVRDVFGEAQRFGATYSDNLTPLIAAGIVYVILVQAVEIGTRWLRRHMHGVSKRRTDRLAIPGTAETS